MIKSPLFLITLLVISSCIETESVILSSESSYLESKTIYIEQNIEGINVDRPVIIQTPLVIDENYAYPIVIGLHGRGGSNSSWIQQLKYFTESGKFIGVYPQGHLKSWNLGQEPSKANDITFIDRIIDTLITYSNVNGDRIFVLGNSNGAGMANKIGANSHRIKAIAPIASQLTVSNGVRADTKPISVFQVHGDSDPLIPIDGGSQFGHDFLSAQESAKMWATQFECNNLPTIEETEQTILSTYSNCEMDVFVKYLVVKGAGHNVSMDYPQLWAEIWEFFDALN